MHMCSGAMSESCVQVTTHNMHVPVHTLCSEEVALVMQQNH